MAAADHAHVVLDHAVPELAELAPDLRADALEEARVVEAASLCEAARLREARGPEEGAEERGALEAELQLDVGRLRPRDRDGH